MKALITAATTAQAYKLQQLLDQKIDFVYADQEEFPVLKEKQFVKIPSGDSATFVHQLLALCLDKHIDWVFPLRKNELKPLAEARLLFEEYDIRIIVPPVAMIKHLLAAINSKGNIFIVMDNEFIVNPNVQGIDPKKFENGTYTINPEDNTQYAIYTAN